MSTSFDGLRQISGLEILDRINEIEDFLIELDEAGDDIISEEAIELAELKDFIENFDPETVEFKREDYYTDSVIRDYLEDMGVPSGFIGYIDFEAVRNDLLSDLTSVELNGETYYVE